MRKSLFFQVLCVVFPEHFNFTSKIKISTFYKLKLTNLGVLGNIFSFNNGSTVIFTLYYLIWTVFFMGLNLLKDNLLVTSMVWTKYFPVLTINLVWAYFSSFHSKSTSFVAAFHYFFRTFKLDMMDHMTSLYIICTTIFALYRSFWTVLHYMSIHFNQR